MAINWLETDVKYGSSPSFQRCVGYEEIGRDGSGVTFRIYLKLKVYGSSSSFYGYGINWRVDGGSWLKVKDASPRWYGNEGYREYTTTIYRSVGASGGSSSFSVQVDGLGGSCDYTSNYTANYSTFNTPPFWISEAYFGVKEWNADGAKIADNKNWTVWNFKAREDVAQYYLYWEGASDRDNNIVRYEVYCSENEGAYTRIYSGSATNYTHYVGGGGSTQGRKYRWFVRAIDAYGMASPDMYVNQIEKNSLTGANLTISTGITYPTTETTLTWSGASNTNGDGNFTYRVNSPNIKVYNIEKLTSSGGKIKVLKSGTSTDPYILFEDLKNLTRNSNFEGFFDLQLVTRNAYGSEVTKSARCWVDIKTDPQAPTSILIGGKTSTSLGAYLIPSKNKPTVTWSGASDLLGGSLTYEVYWKIGNGGETLISAGTNTSITLPISNVTSSATLGVRVVAKTSYGRSSSASNNAETLHYYNPPSVYMTNPNRTITSFTVDIISQLNTSIPNVKFAKQRYTGNGVTKDFTGLKYTATLTGLLENSTFDFTAIVNDNTGLSSDQSSVFKVVPAIPKLSVREGGVGINCVGSSEATLKVGGTLKVTSNIATDGVVYSKGSVALTQADKSTNTSFLGKVVGIGNDGVSEIGQYLDFHFKDSTKDYDYRMHLLDRDKMKFYGDLYTKSINLDTIDNEVAMVYCDRNILFSTGRVKNVMGANIRFDGTNDVHIDGANGASQIVMETKMYPRFRWSTTPAGGGVAQWTQYFDMLTNYEGQNVVMARGTVTDGADWNVFKHGGVYQVACPNYSANQPPNSYYYGILLTIHSQEVIGQIYMPHSGSHFMQYRVRYNSGNWTSWANVGWSQYSTYSLATASKATAMTTGASTLEEPPTSETNTDKLISFIGDVEVDTSEVKIEDGFAIKPIPQVSPVDALAKTVKSLQDKINLLEGELQTLKGGDL